MIYRNLCETCGQNLQKISETEYKCEYCGNVVTEKYLMERQQEAEANRESSAGLKFKLNKDGKGYTLTKVGSCTEKHIVIDMHKGLPVTSIGRKAFEKCSNLTSIYCFDNWDNIVGIKNAGIPKKQKFSIIVRKSRV